MSVQSTGTGQQQGGDQQGGQQSGQQGAGQQGGGDQSGQQQGGSLLDDLAGQQQQAAGDQQGQGDGNQQTGQTGQQGGATQTLTADQIADIVERAVDRRINERVAQRAGGGGNGGGQQQQGGGGSDQQQERRDQPGQQTSSGPSREDLREARAEYRDAVADQITFFPFEREFASGLAAQLLSDRLGRGGYPDTVGREVAREVASQVKALRGQYEQATLAALRRKGLLPDTAAGQQPPPGGVQPGDQSSFAKGQAAAARLLPHRFPQDQQGQQ